MYFYIIIVLCMHTYTMFHHLGGILEKPGSLIARHKILSLHSIDFVLNFQFRETK